LSAHQVKTATSNRRSIKDENLETAPHVLRFFDLSPKVSSLNTVYSILERPEETEARFVSVSSCGHE
ncbi:hypothetical protein, partial [Enterococcus hirae]|uniref:hypothetical protein n=1 Tax=Enterococcus hirae TaxID=1354 RepID=UPI001A9755C6